MAALGDYIHYRYSNYKKYGLARKLNNKISKEQQGDVNWLSNYVNGKKSLLNYNSVNQSQLNQIQKQLNYLMNKQIVPKNEQKNIEEIQNIIYEMVKQTAVFLSPEDIDWEKLTISSSGLSKMKSLKNQLNLPLTIRTLKQGQIGQGDKTYIASYRKRINSIQLGIDYIAQSLDKNTIQELQNKLTKISNEIKQIGSINVNSQTTGWAKDLQELAKEVYQLGVKTILQGQLAEYVFAAAVQQVISSEEKITKEMLQNLVVGNQGGKNIYIKSNFGKGLELSNILSDSKTIQDPETGNYIVNNSSFGKIDVQANLKDSEIFANIKNYNLSSKRNDSISLVSGARALYVLQGQAEFVNHYLNQASVPDKRVGPSLGIINAANKYFKQMLLIMSAMGGGIKQNYNLSGKNANVFAINDNSQPCGFRVISMQSFITRNINNLEDILKLTPDIPQWKNYWANSGPKNRIENLLSQMNKYKFSVKVKFSAFK